MNIRYVRRRAVLFALLLMAAAGRVPAAPLSADPSIEAETVSEFFHNDIAVAADGTAVLTVDQQTRFVTDNAARNGSHVLLGYQPGYSGIEVLEAWTLKKDGSRLAVPAGSIQTQSGRASQGAFSDAKTIQIEFPQVEAGGAIAYRYRETVTRPRFPGQFTNWNWFGERQLWREVRITVDAPQDYPLRVAQREGALTESIADGRHRWTWRWASPGDRLETPEGSTLFPSMILPGFFVSSLRDYAQLAEIYRGIFYPQAAPTAKAQQLADALTAGIDDPREQARKLFDWVRLNIRYVQIYLGDGGLKPHEVDAILAAHFGDCKDHAALLGALLAAKGIGSTPVLIGAQRDYTLPEPPQPFIFNHVITYVPLLGRYLDSTARYGSFEQLPSGDLGVPVVHIDDGGIHQTPPRSADRDRTETFTTLAFAADGSASGTFRLLGEGADSIPLRAQFETMDAAQRPDFVSTLLLSRGLIGDGDFSIDPDLPPTQYAVTLHLEIRNLLNPVDASALALEPLLRGPQRLFDTAAAGQRYKLRRHPTGCSQSAVEDHYDLRFPPGYRIELPHAVGADEGDDHYRSDYRREADRVRIDRVYDNRSDRTVCAAEDYPRFRRFTAALMQDLREQIAYRAPAGRGIVATKR